MMGRGALNQVVGGIGGNLAFGSNENINSRAGPGGSMTAPSAPGA